MANNTNTTVEKKTGLKPYDELVKIDVTPYCEKRDDKDELLYLPWAKCVDLLHENGAKDVYFLPIRGMNGSSLIATDQVFTDKNGVANRCYETAIEIHIDDLTFAMQGPVLNGSNPVKDNSMTQQRLWNAQTRLFVKGVAIRTGLGFNLWIKNENEERKAVAEADFYHDIKKVQTRVLETVTALNKKGLTLKDIAEKLNRTEDELKNYLSMYNTLFAVEHNLEVLLKQENEK